MKDPKVTELVKQFEKDVKTLNASWKKLQDNDVYVSLRVEGTSSYTDPKYVSVDKITQWVQYKEAK